MKTKTKDKRTKLIVRADFEKEGYWNIQNNKINNIVAYMQKMKEDFVIP